MTTRRSRFERRAQLEQRLEKSLDGLADAVNDMTGERDLDRIMYGLEAVEKELSRAKRRAEQLMEGER